FEYPSRLPESAQRDAERVACRALEAIGFDHGLFNVELFWRPRDGAVKIIEINPRLAAQFADLYEKVDGMNPYRVLADLAIGRDREDLFRRYDSVCANLAFERPARLAFGNPLGALRPER